MRSWPLLPKYNFPLKENGDIEAQMMKDFWALGLQKCPRSAATPSVFKGDLKQNWSSSYTSWHRATSSAGLPVMEGLGAWNCEVQLCRGTWFILPLIQTPCAEAVSPSGLWCPRCSPRCVCPLLCVLSASLLFFWDPGDILVSALRSSSALGH